METRSDYGKKQKRKKFESDVRFEIKEFEIDGLDYYTHLAQQLGFATLKEFLEDECQRALFALTTKVQPDINYFIV